VEERGDTASFHVKILDTSFLVYKGERSAPGGEARPGEKAYSQRTEIWVEVETLKSQRTMEDENVAHLDSEAEARISELLTSPPTEKELGIPVYPAARFDARASGGMTMDNDTLVYVFLSDDLVPAVVAFYEKATGRKAEPAAGAAFQIRLKGSSSIPEHGVFVQPNTMFGGTARTVITVTKQRKR
jgi:hypothetical protein